jgi:hypothetical protein
VVVVSGLTVADYLLWDWALAGGHDVFAVVAGLTLPPLVLAWLWLLGLTLARLALARTRPPTAATVRRSEELAIAALDIRRIRDADAGVPLSPAAEPTRAGSPPADKLAA